MASAQSGWLEASCSLTGSIYHLWRHRAWNAVTSANKNFRSSKTSRTHVVSIYDVEVQCVAFSCALPNLSCIFLLDSVLMLLSKDGTLSALTEKHISAKLEILFKKNLYDLAVGYEFCFYFRVHPST